jgi:aryl-alcohol dehydrogenase-like predicted oxidoreductase
MSVQQYKALGGQGLIVSQEGFGCMGMTSAYGTFNRADQEEDNLKTIAKALEVGINHFDTAWVYQSWGMDGAPNTTNEELLGKAIAIHGRDKFIVATKFGFVPTASGIVVSGSEETIRSQLADSLSRLGTDYIDLYYMHRMDSNTPIEDTMRVLKSLVEAGTIRYIGLSECTPSELRRAHAVHPITAIQMEWNLQARSIEAELVPTARELGVGIVVYSPLGAGMLSATITSRDQLDAGDSRATRNERFSAENLVKNIPTSTFTDIAARKGCTPAQLALAWLFAQGDDVFPIPGTKNAARVVENANAVLVTLSVEEVKEVEAAVPTPVGERNPCEFILLLYLSSELMFMVCRFIRSSEVHL